MKWLVFLLVLANLLFFAFTEGYIAQVPNPDTLRMNKQVRPDDIRVVSRDTPPPAKAPVSTEATPAVSAAQPPAEKPPAPAEACLAWAGLASKDADRLATLLKEQFADFKQTRRVETSTVKNWWVFIPPLPNKTEADKKASELKQLGIKDFIVVQDGGSKPLAISLGVFANEAAAKTRFAQVRDKGVRSAKLEPHSSKDAVLMEARGPGIKRQALLDATQAMTTPKLEAKACQ
ncbi:MAG: hypothetical protein H6R18_1426 [Proteobacteria bacterium]|nr:hypothetical protein [Pseudomonadota bacterium]